MAGTPEGGRLAAKHNKANHGPGFYKRIGKKGGLAPHSKPRGWAADREKASHYGHIGGRRRHGLNPRNTMVDEDDVLY